MIVSEWKSLTRDDLKWSNLYTSAFTVWLQQDSWWFNGGVTVKRWAGRTSLVMAASLNETSSVTIEAYSYPAKLWEAYSESNQLQPLQEDSDEQ